MTINFEDVLYLSGGLTSAITKRTSAARAGDVFNVMDYGAVGTGTPTPLSRRYGSLGAAQAVYPFVTSLAQECDYAAIQLAINTMWATPRKGGILFLPVGNYLTNDEIDIGNHEIGSNYSYGIIEGSGSFINGNVPNGFIFYQDDGVNGPGTINDLVLVNTSTNIGSGGLRINNSSCEFNNCGFVGMIGALTPFNIYDMRFNHCGSGANSDVTTGYNGTLGIAGSVFSVNGWRTTTPCMTMFTLQGSDTGHFASIGVENVCHAFACGIKLGWGGNCTVAPDGSNPGFSILTVAGKVGSTGNRQFEISQVLFMKGIALPRWNTLPIEFDNAGGETIVADHSTDPALTGDGFTGTYRISGTYTISTPVPLWTRSPGHVNCVHLSAIQGEANWCQVYIYNLGGGSFKAMGAGANPIECIDQWGTTGLTSRCGFYVRSGTAFSFEGCVPAGTTYRGEFEIAYDATLTNVSFISCVAKKFANNITTATISNGSGGAGKILNVGTFTSGAGIGVGMTVYDGSSLLTTITKNHLLDPTYTGTITTGTYEVADSLNISSRTLTIRTGEGWALDLVPGVAKPGIKFINCGTSNLPGVGYTDGFENYRMLYNELPGQAGSSGSNTSLHDGMSYFIVDAVKSGGGTAAPGDIVQGGGTQKIPVFWDGTDWRYGGSGQFG